MKKEQGTDCAHCKIRHDSLLSDLCMGELKELSIAKVCRSYKKGEDIFVEGNQPDGVYCISSGKAKIYKMGSQGKEQIVRLVKPGDLMGYRAFVSGDPYSASAKALEECSVCYIPGQTFETLIETNETFGRRLMKNICRELKQAEEFIQSLSQKSVRERMAEVLILLKNKYGMDAKDPQILNITITREDLSNMVGTAIETAIRTLADLKEEGLISFEGRRVRLLKPGELMELANLED